MVCLMTCGWKENLGGDWVTLISEKAGSLGTRGPERNVLRRQREFISPPDLEIHFDKVNRTGEPGIELQGKQFPVAIRSGWRGDFSLLLLAAKL